MRSKFEIEKTIQIEMNSFTARRQSNEPTHFELSPIFHFSELKIANWRL